MAGIKDIYRSTDAFRFPTWDHAVSYPANSVVAYYDSEFDRWAHYIAIQQTIPGSLDSEEIKLNEWVEMSFDSDTLYRYALRALQDSLDDFKGYLQPRVDSDVLVFLDSEFPILAANVDSDVKQTLAIHRDSDSDMRVAFEARLIGIIESNDSDIREKVDSDISSFSATMAMHDSDIQYHAHRIDNFWDHLDSDVNYLKRIYGNNATLALQNANNTAKNTNDIAVIKADTDSDIIALRIADAAFTATLNNYQTKADADSDFAVANVNDKRLADLDSEITNVRVNAETFNETTRNLARNWGYALANADSDNKVAIEADYNRKFAEVDSEILRVDMSISTLAAQIVGSAVGEGGSGKVDSDFVLEVANPEVDSDWVSRQISAAGSPAGAGNRIFLSGTIPSNSHGTNGYVVKNWGLFTDTEWNNATHSDLTLSIVRSDRSAYQTHKYQIQFNNSTDPGSILWREDQESTTALGISNVVVIRNSGGLITTTINIDTEAGELNWYLHGFNTVIT